MEAERVRDRLRRLLGDPSVQDRLDDRGRMPEALNGPDVALLAGEADDGVDFADLEAEIARDLRAVLMRPPVHHLVADVVGVVAN